MTDHSGHRARLKNALRETGLSSFAPHEVIELMLYTALPRRDVNELAHYLDEAFGGAAGLLRASESELVTKGGLTENAARIIAAYGKCVRGYMSLYDADERVTTKKRAEELLEGTGGKIRMLLLSNGGKVLFISKVPEAAYEKFIFSHCALYDAASAFIMYEKGAGVNVNTDVFRKCGIEIYLTERDGCG